MEGVWRCVCVCVCVRSRSGEYVGDRNAATTMVADAWICKIMPACLLPASYVQAPPLSPLAILTQRGFKIMQTLLSKPEESHVLPHYSE